MEPLNSVSSVVPVLTEKDILEKLQKVENLYWPQYFAFYSSWYGGIIKNPGSWLLLPVDDHLVHRGDGVFEAIKVVQRRIFLLEPHLNRLRKSAEKIGLSYSFSDTQLTDIIVQTLKVADQPNAIIRIFLSRGPGAFSANPYDAIAPQLYIVITNLNSIAEEKYVRGVHVGRSIIPTKEGFMPQIKSCNYLPNVLMKKESVDRNLDFTVNFDRQNFLAESATENMVIVDSGGILTKPMANTILTGTTMTRAFQLAEQNGITTATRNITEQDIFAAKEVLMMGTTLDVLPVTSYENKKIYDQKVGPIAIKLRELFKNDMASGLLF